MAAIAGHCLLLYHIGKLISFFSETTKMIVPKLSMNIHLMSLDHDKVDIFYVERKSKMAATTGKSLTEDPMGNHFHISFKQLNRLKRKLAEVFLELSCRQYPHISVNQKSKNE
jgi:hypothetical protein